MTRYLTIAHLANSKCEMLKYIPTSFSKTVNAHNISAEHVTAIISKRSRYAYQISSKSKCITIEHAEQQPSDQEIQRILLICTFLLNLFAHKGFPLFGDVFILKQRRQWSLDRAFELPNSSSNTQQPYLIDRSIDPRKISVTFEAVQAAIEKDASLSISLNRFNEATSGANSESKIIDISICLESIFQSQTEISFQFALYNAILSDVDPQKRLSHFKILRELYKHRSNVVHGKRGADEKFISDQWGIIENIAKLSILRKVDFLSYKNKNDWQDYLLDLLLGVAAEQNHE